MPTTTIYHSTKELPDYFECQIRAYIRFLWHDHYFYDLDEPLALAESHPHYVVLSDRHALISAATIVWANTIIDGHSFRIYGLGNVFTYPAFRKQGYGQQVVKTATEFIQSQQKADMGILFTDKTLEGFYGQSGWEYIPDLSVYMGPIDNLERYDAFSMMLFLSDKAQGYRIHLNEHTLFLPNYSW